MQTIDTTQSVVGSVNRVLGAGYHGIIRYISRDTSNFPQKRLTTKEAASIHAVPGMRIGLVYENDPVDSIYFTTEQAAEDGTDAIETFAALKAPSQVPVFFTVDYDASDEDLAGPILEYFSSLHAQFTKAGRLIGVYGSGQSCSKLKEAGIVHFTWLAQSTGWNGYSRWKTSADVIQGPESIVAGLDADTDYVVNEAVLW